MKANRFMLGGVVMLLVLGGCASYSPKSGLLGRGYSDAQLDRNTFSVVYNGGSFSSREQAQTFLLYRCAETTLLHKFDYFVIENDRIEETGIRFLTGVGAKTTIKTYYGAKPQTIASSYNAREVLDLLSFMVKE